MSLRKICEKWKRIDETFHSYKVREKLVNCKRIRMNRVNKVVSVDNKNLCKRIDEMFHSFKIREKFVNWNRVPDLVMNSLVIA